MLYDLVEKDEHVNKELWRYWVTKVVRGVHRVQEAQKKRLG